MEEKFLEKEYNIPYEIFGEAYTDFQKKYVNPRNYILMGIFIALGFVYVYSALKDPNNTIAYLLMVVCFAFAGINWYNPKRIKRSLMEGIRGIENEKYKLELFESHIEISTLVPPEEIEEVDENNIDSDHERELFGDKPDEVAESSKLYFNDRLKIVEKDKFFILYQLKELFYVVPKSGFSDDELEIFRKKIGINE
ncbi:MAG: YcxB family protein [Ruminococcus sp.]|nr:YcxB family protein [Ruminococcus sp.]MBR6671058.1 YcxB family protein [Ruminococcus sp.]